MTKFCCRLLSFTLALTLVFSTFPIAPAHAGMIGTKDVLAHTSAIEDRAVILSVLERGDVVAELQRQGVSLADAKARVAALSDNEARMMAAQLENLPAGAASDIFGVLVGLFLILLVTDLLGLTAVFPFTRTRARI